MQNLSKGLLTFNDGYNLKNEVIAYLNAHGVNYSKVVHHVESPYQKRRFKPEYVEQEVRIYTTTCTLPIIITQDDWASMVERKVCWSMFDGVSRD